MGGLGAAEVYVDGQLVFAKDKSGRLPSLGDIKARIAAATKK